MNFFEQAGDRQLSGAQKAKERAKVRTQEKREAKLRPPSPLEQKQIEGAVLAKMYRAWKRQIRRELIEAHGRDFAELMRLLRNLHWTDAERVVEYVENAMWLRRADPDTRFSTLGYIDSSLERSRVRYGLPPLDDGLWDEEPGPFIKIRRLLGDV